MKCLAIDPGKKYYGVAVVSELGEISQYGSIFIQNHLTQLIERIKEIIELYQPDCLVYGYNTNKHILNYSGSSTALLIRKNINKPLFFQSENYSTLEVKRYYSIAKQKKIVKKKIGLSRTFKDGWSAVLIAKRWLERCI